MSMTHQHCSGDLKHKSDLRLILAIIVNVLLTIVQIIGGIVAGSLSLVADAVHNLSDAMSLVIALVARRISRKPSDHKMTFGYRRAEVIAALINITTLIMTSLYLLYEAVIRFFEDQVIDGWIVVWVAGIALLIDLITAALTYSLSENSLNIKAAFLHNLADAFVSVGVIISGALVILFQWTIADLIVTIAISTYLFWHSALMMKPTVRILMDGTPSSINVEDIENSIKITDGIKDVYHLHVRHISEDVFSLEAHVVVACKDLNEIASIKKDLRKLLHDKYFIDHTTLEIEFPNSGGSNYGCIL